MADLPPTEEHEPAPDEPEHHRNRTRNLVIGLVIAVLAFGFGRAITNGYYFGGCDEAANSRHYLTHVFGIKMCRDEHAETAEEAAAKRELEAPATTPAPATASPETPTTPEAPATTSTEPPQAPTTGLQPKEPEQPKEPLTPEQQREQRQGD